MQPQMAQARRRHNLSPQPNGVSSNIGEIKQWLCEVPTHERGALSSLRIEASKVIIKERHWHTTATEVAWSAAVSRIKTPWPCPASLIAAPGWQQLMFARGPAFDDHPATFLQLD